MNSQALPQIPAKTKKLNYYYCICISIDASISIVFALIYEKLNYYYYYLHFLDKLLLLDKDRYL